MLVNKRRLKGLAALDRYLHSCCCYSMIAKTPVLLTTMRSKSGFDHPPVITEDIGSIRINDLRNLSNFCEHEPFALLYLTSDGQPPLSGDKQRPSNVMKAHYTEVLPEEAPAPYLISASTSCAKSLQLNPNELKTNAFVDIFSGNEPLPGSTRPYCFNYGSHSYGQWNGQLGDGRAITIAEIQIKVAKEIEADSVICTSGTINNNCNVAAAPHQNVSQELQLKGCGRTPYSRGFDGRAVVRSSVREYLASEAMHHLGVPSTRALCVIGTGALLRRPWYEPSAVPAAVLDSMSFRDEKASTYVCSTISNTVQFPPSPPTEQLQQQQQQQQQQQRVGRKYGPHTAFLEQGAVLCRVSRSFLRFGQLELFGKRSEHEQLQTLADYVCRKEFPHLFTIKNEEEEEEEEANQGEKANEVEGGRGTGTSTKAGGAVERYTELFRCIAMKSAHLVVEWMRVGYVQGNMNSDNMLLGGRTLDYGPFGFMEKFDPHYQPWIADTDGTFSFNQQPDAMLKNITILADTAFKPLIRYVAQSKDPIPYGPEYMQGLRELGLVVNEEFLQTLHNALGEMRGRKLGLARFSCTVSSAGTTAKTITDTNTNASRKTSNDSTSCTAIETDVTAAATAAVAYKKESGSHIYDHHDDNDDDDDDKLWSNLENLMHRSGCDFTIFFRELSHIADIPSCAADADATPAPATSTTTAATVSSTCKSSSGSISGGVGSGGSSGISDACVDEALQILSKSLYGCNSRSIKDRDSCSNSESIALNLSTEIIQKWREWFQVYLRRIKRQNVPLDVRRSWQRSANPKYILRNWMSALAYEEAESKSKLMKIRNGEDGDDEKEEDGRDVDYISAAAATTTEMRAAVAMADNKQVTTGSSYDVHNNKDCVIEELMNGVLLRPYEEGTPQEVRKWYRKTPDWAVGLPGVAFLS